MHHSDGAFSGRKSWFSDHFGGNDRLIDSDWIKRKSLAKKEPKEKESQEHKEPVTTRAVKKTASRKPASTIAAKKAIPGSSGRRNTVAGEGRVKKKIKDK